MPNADELVAEYLQIRDYQAKESKRFEEYLKPGRDRLSEIENQLMELLNAQGGKSLKTEHGTCYKSVIVTPKIVDREKYLDVVPENYETWGAGMLQLAKPKKESIDEYMESNGGKLPEGVECSTYVRLNVMKG